jgi:hypothetical protein
LTLGKRGDGVSDLRPVPALRDERRLGRVREQDEAAPVLREADVEERPREPRLERPLAAKVLQRPEPADERLSPIQIHERPESFRSSDRADRVWTAGVVVGLLIVAVAAFAVGYACGRMRRRTRMLAVIVGEPPTRAGLTQPPERDARRAA